MIVLDASVMIALLEATDVHHGRAQSLYLSSDDDLAASSITLAEVLVRPAAEGQLTRATRALEDLGVVEIPLPTGAAQELAALRAETRLKLPDCCVLLQAQASSARLATFDDKLAEVARTRSVAVLTG